MRPSLVLALSTMLLALPAAALPASYDVPPGLPTPTQVTRGGFIVAMEFAPDGTLVWADLEGPVKELPPGATTPIKIHEVQSVRGPEWGVTGLALAPDYTTTKDVYIAYITAPPGVDPDLADAKGTMRVSKLHDGQETVIFTLEATRSHNSGRLLYHDDTLFFSNGEHTQGSGTMESRMRAQDPDDIGGKILRMTLDGKPAPGNPYEKDPNYDPFVYSMGHRNPFGLAWDDTRDRLVMSDPGPDCCEEINAIEPGGNYGWPVCRGACDPAKPGMLDPLVYYPEVITPVGMTVLAGEYYTGGFNTNEVRRAYDTGAGWTDEVVAVVEAGMLDVEATPDGKEIWIGTWNGVWKIPAPAPREAPVPREDPPAEDPPVEEPPVDEPPVDEPPAGEDPTTGGAPKESLPPAAGKSVPGASALLAFAAVALVAVARRR